MKTLQHVFYSVTFSLLLLTSIAGMQGCAKNNGAASNTTTSVLLDSVISDELTHSWPHVSLKYVYDSQERVIEERISHDDTLKTRRTYEYQGNSMLPFKMNSYKKNSTTPEFISEFTYNANGQKIYDTTYGVSGSTFVGTMGVRLDYSIAGKIAIKQEQHPSFSYYYDTIFFHNGNIDSAITPVNVKSIMPGYSSYLNVFNRLNISSCRFYSPAPNYIGSMRTGMFYQIVDDIPIEYFNVNNHVTSTPNVQYDYQYNSSNLPVILKVTTTGAPSYLNITQFRFVYK